MKRRRINEISDELAQKVLNKRQAQYDRSKQLFDKRNTMKFLEEYDYIVLANKGSTISDLINNYYSVNNVIPIRYFKKFTLQNESKLKNYQCFGLKVSSGAYNLVISDVGADPYYYITTDVNDTIDYIQREYVNLLLTETNILDFDTIPQIMDKIKKDTGINIPQDLKSVEEIENWIIDNALVTFCNEYNLNLSAKQIDIVDITKDINKLISNKSYKELTWDDMSFHGTYQLDDGGILYVNDMGEEDNEPYINISVKGGENDGLEREFSAGRFNNIRFTGYSLDEKLNERKEEMNVKRINESLDQDNLYLDDMKRFIVYSVSDDRIDKIRVIQSFDTIDEAYDYCDALESDYRLPNPPDFLVADKNKIKDWFPELRAKFKESLEKTVNLRRIQRLNEEMRRLLGEA